MSTKNPIEERNAWLLSDIPDLISLPQMPDRHICKISTWCNHFETSLSVPDVADEIRKLMEKSFDENIKALKVKIWDYMAEHPTKDRSIVISPETHDLILEEIGYSDGGNACYMYAKKFYFKLKEEKYE